MPETRAKITRRKSLAIVLAIAAVLLILIVIRFLTAPSDGFDLSTLDGREAFLNELGWEIDRSSEQYRTVVVPGELEGIMLQYNKMQQSQGYDLSSHLGERCQQYTYKLTNYADCDGTVLVTLYVQDKDLIAGDIHTTSANGFMHGLRRNENT